jgi:HrpA-like RNA helicase
MDPEMAKDLDDYLAGVDDEEVDLELVTALTVRLVQTAHSQAQTQSNGRGAGYGGRVAMEAGLGAVLVFLPGWEEISRGIELMRGNSLLGNPSRVQV